MILELAMVAIVAADGVPPDHTVATEDASAPPVAAPGPSPVAASVDDTLKRHRKPFDVLLERTIGSASKSVRFDWRRTDLQLAATSGALSELNNFNSMRAGVRLRRATQSGVMEFGFNRAWVWSTVSTRRLARTPYRQPGRPSRFELDFGYSIALAEGVVTAWPSFFPAAQLVFNGVVELRYLIYPGSFSGLKFTRAVRAALSPGLTDAERRNLEADRPAAMEIDGARLSSLIGFSTDIYFQSGFFVTPKFLLSVPVASGIGATKLILWWNVSLAAGLAF